MNKKLASHVWKLPVLLLVAGLLAMGSCKSKKKAVQPEPEPVQEEVVKPTPPPVPVAPAPEEVAVEKLENHFNSLATSSNPALANRQLNEALSLFSNPETPVLIVIHEENGIKDYDEPTTIRRYLEYLKDTRSNRNFISDIRLDSSGKVAELELRRK